MPAVAATATADPRAGSLLCGRTRHVRPTAGWQLAPLEARHRSMMPWGTERDYLHVLRSTGAIPGFVLPDPARRARAGDDDVLGTWLWAISFLARSLSALWKKRTELYGPQLLQEGFQLSRNGRIVQMNGDDGQAWFAVWILGMGRFEPECIELIDHPGLGQ